ncbi:murein biosynthesis integral membrane protein MurJ [Bifidobacterium tibiigranuli]|jgi:putative peptidoglycan lipid II flippase|uniref:murein biosynthesis integral membrane protein MurJ n=1 Tax=Bifidobacterium tibiigranuli TaxID=2172043 RepID=UPI0026EFB63E|nr:murein biosynthesis integral membrane protein MurJ [Bifidobacterium tibiigranuli]
MSSSVGRNSLIMATGTAASRLTGQIRTILLAAAIGTTGLAANAYQAGSMIPQVVFTLVSGGIFNAVLVPQIVRTLQQKDAEDRLNKLITFAVVLLLAVTLLMTAGTPLLTRLYVGGGSDMLALTNAFTLWCMPQIFFYGLYTVVGQILAAKDHFGTYAWSSVGANVISSVGFVAFIALFGRADRQPLGFWTTGKIGLTAGMWTLGVAFQALVLFLPLRKAGIRYRPSWGLKGIGLRAMGPVAAWSVGIVAVEQLATIINTNVTTSAPDRAARLLGLSQFDVAGNASYQNAYTIYILPYSLIAVSVATAMFPRISRAVAGSDIASARASLSQSLRNVGLMMCFFTAVFLVMPTPITLALLPSISVHEAALMAGPLVALAVNLPMASAYLIIQRTFYAFEDGKHPFLFIALQSGLQLVVLLAGVLLLSPVHWAMLLGASISIAYLLAFPLLARMLRKRFGGFMDGRRILRTYSKALVAAAVAVLVGWRMSRPVYTLVGAHMSGMGLGKAGGAIGADGSMSWLQAVAACFLLGLLVSVLYALVLWLARTEEFTAMVGAMVARLARRVRTAPSSSAGSAGSPSLRAHGTRQPHATRRPDAVESAGRTRVVSAAAPAAATASAATPTVSSTTSSTTSSAVVPPPMFDPKTHELVSRDSGPSKAQISAIPTGRISTAPQMPAPQPRHGVEGIMKPELGDVVINRYTLVSLLRDEPGLHAWKANDRALARDCQLFIVNDAEAIDQVNDIASSLVLSKNPHVTPVLQLQQREGVAIVVTQLDAGSALREYCQGRADRMLGFAAMRSILGEAAQTAQQLLAGGMERLVLDTDTIRITSRGIQLADVPFGPIMADAVKPPQGIHGEQLATWQLAAVLYAMLTETPSGQIAGFDPARIPQDTPDEFILICKRALHLRGEGESYAVPMVTLGEFSALLGDWKPVNQLTPLDLTKPASDGPASITLVPLLTDNGRRLLELPDAIFTSARPSYDAAASTAAGTAGAAGTSAAPGAATSAAGAAGGIAALGTGFRSLWGKGKSALGQTEQAADAQLGDVPDFRDVAASEMAEIIAPDEPDYGTLFSNFDFNAEQGDSTGTGPMQFDFSTQMVNPVGFEESPATGSFEATGRIPVIDSDGHALAPGAESQRALAAEQAQREAAALPPSFTPAAHAHGTHSYGTEQSANPAAGVAGAANPTVQPNSPKPSAGDDEDIADAPLFGKITTKVVAIVAVAVIVITALGLAMHGLLNHGSSAVGGSQTNQWPTTNLNDVPFGGNTGSPDNKASAGAGKDAASPKTTPKATTNAPEAAKKPAQPSIITADRNVGQVPAPKVPLNSTPFDIDKQEFLTNPGGQRGYAYYMHLSQPQNAYRFVIKIRSSGGTAYLRANTANNPTQGQQVAQFSFDASGTTNVKFTKPVNAQDFLLWVPADSLPGNQLYIDSVQLF